MSMVGRVGEGLARRMNRRQTLKRTTAAIFGAVAAWSVQGFRGSSVLAEVCSYVTTGDCSCNPPYGLYCKRIDASYCSGATCSGGCAFDETYRYVGACWCSATCQYTAEDGSPLFGFYKCCDCMCYGQQCSCREFIQGAPENEEPGPQTPGGPPGPPPFPPGFPFND